MVSCDAGQLVSGHRKPMCQDIGNFLLPIIGYVKNRSDYFVGCSRR